MQHFWRRTTRLLAATRALYLSLLRLFTHATASAYNTCCLTLKLINVLSFFGPCAYLGKIPLILKLRRDTELLYFEGMAPHEFFD